MQKLIERWRKDAEQYMRQVDEARKAGTPHDQMLSMATALQQCAKELEAETRSAHKQQAQSPRSKS